MTPTLPSVSARMCRKTPEEPVIKKTISRDEEGPATECPTLHDLCLSRAVRVAVIMYMVVSMRVPVVVPMVVSMRVPVVVSMVVSMRVPVVVSMRVPM